MMHGDIVGRIVFQIRMDRTNDDTGTGFIQQLAAAGVGCLVFFRQRIDVGVEAAPGELETAEQLPYPIVQVAPDSLLIWMRPS